MGERSDEEENDYRQQRAEQRALDSGRAVECPECGAVVLVERQGEHECPERKGMEP